MDATPKTDCCPKCGESLMPAMIRCRACGWLRGTKAAFAEPPHEESRSTLPPPFSNSSETASAYPISADDAE